VNWTAAGEFDVLTRRDGLAVVVAVVGAVDVASAPVLDRVLERVVQDRTTAMTVDLRDVGFLDSSGVRVLFRALRRNRTLGVAMLLCIAPSAPVTRVLHLSGMLTAVPVVGTC
jgi:anti-anti-sigma factor